MNSTKYWLKPDWPAPANVFAATTLRSGGFSTGSFQSLNPAMHVGDNPELVLKNRQRIIGMLDLPNAPVWLNQVHGKTVVDASQVNTLVEADASFSHEPGVVCTVLTADCLPVLLCSRDGRSVAAVHAGWRGLLAGVIVESVKAMKTLDLLVWLGPAIGPDAFEVGDDVRTAFVESNERYADGFRAVAKGKWLADIYCLARINLALAGIESVYGGQFCTLSDVERFYSFRRDKETGRMASLIWRI
ncbi:peptidoglycan editing factor PgeF [Methylotuvimicrobium alcaliphilum]|uniref:Purine nucleoside phosphorylase n=1 Tax=Methylotuvimicrobium alcaliphilum (strain DSM 19304 / NCIMB 14124 / VKM B-2133 / 20Z) TaxID=1091494 RepID=G4SVD7_META2|nr:peptidoglycan editing factor PgeF [Methylotuvimicrobium alcaliphilum]CCE22909.1 conserved hypothetical protein [Methylotuvimicrobium alcaliphilum 20Z]